MGFIDRLKAAFTPKVNRQAEKPAPNAGFLFVPPYQQNQPAAWATDKAEEVKHFKHWAYAAISAIASRVAAAEIHLYAQKGEDSEEILDHPFLDLIYAVNPFKTKFDLWWETIMFLELTGDAYWYLPKNRLGIPGEIWVCPSPYTKIVGSIASGIERYEYKLPGAVKPVVFAPDEMIHFRYPSPVDLFYGYSPLRAGAEAIDTYEHIKTAQYQAFLNGILPSAVLTTPADVNPNPADLDKLVKTIKAKYGGSDKSGAVIALTQGMNLAKWSLTPKEMEFGESSKLLRDEILAIFKVPAAIAGLSQDVNRASADALEIIFSRNTIQPKLKMISDAMNQSLLPMYDASLWVEFETVLPEDELTNAQTSEVNLRSGLVTINEERQRRGLEPVAWGDEPWLAFTLSQPGSEPQDIIPVKSQISRPGGTKRDFERHKDIIPQGKRFTAEGWKLQRKAIWKRFDAGLVRIEKPFAKEIASEFNREKKEVLKNWEASAALLEKVAADFRELPIEAIKTFLVNRSPVQWLEFFDNGATDEEIRVAGVSEIVKEVGDDLYDQDEAAEFFGELSGKYYKAAINDGGLHEVESLGDLGFIGARFAPDAAKVAAYLAGKKRDYWEGTVTQTTVDRLNAVITSGLANGDSGKVIGDAIAEMFDSRSHSAMNIARTEMVGAANEGHQEARSQNGIDDKEWVNSADEFVRDSHQDGIGVGGEVVPNGEPFSNGLMYPGDPAGDISETANCRCVSVGVFQQLEILR